MGCVNISREMYEIMNAPPVPPSETPPVFRVGTVQFLNAAPLVWRLEEFARKQDARVELFRDLPSRLVPGLLAGEYDVALIPVAEAVRNPRLVHVSDACISSHGRVESIKLLSRVPIHEVRRVALDGASRSSAAMVQVCLADYFKVRPEFVTLPAEDEMLRRDAGRMTAADAAADVDDAFLDTLADTLAARDLDAVLVIGDSAMVVPLRDGRMPVIQDMGQCWTQWTGLPFTYASWFARPGVDTRRLSHLLSAVRQNAELEMLEIVDTEASQRNLSRDFCLDYLTRKIRYRLGGAERRSMEVFIRMGQKIGLFPLGSGVRFEER